MIQNPLMIGLYNGAANYQRFVVLKSCNKINANYQLEAQVKLGEILIKIVRVHSGNPPKPGCEIYFP